MKPIVDYGERHVMGIARVEIEAYGAVEMHYWDYEDLRDELLRLRATGERARVLTIQEPHSERRGNVSR